MIFAFFVSNFSHFLICSCSNVHLVSRHLQPISGQFSSDISSYFMLTDARSIRAALIFLPEICSSCICFSSRSISHFSSIAFLLPRQYRANIFWMFVSTASNGRSYANARIADAVQGPTQGSVFKNVISSGNSPLHFVAIIFAVLRRFLAREQYPSP